MLKTANPPTGAARRGNGDLPAARAGSVGLAPNHASDADRTITVLRTHSLPGLVQQELTRMILSGEFPAGAKLNEVDLALRLGVSRGPVREAFRALEESGLVRLEKNRGVFVREIAVAEADEIYELRAVLDEYAGRRAAQGIAPVDLKSLRALVERMDRAVSHRDLDAYHAANVEFHDTLVRLAGNGKLLATYRRLVNELHLYRRAAIAQRGALPQSVREHHEILDRIEAGQSAAAGRALFDHVMGSRERMHRVRAAAKPARPQRKR